jgi:ubiquinone/menaquinone biosynthesis C-methylase UbiE
MAIAMTQSKPPNADQAALWNDASGRTWVEMQTVLDRILAPFVAPLVERTRLGERVLDIGCGSGATTFAVGRRVGPHGHCLGVDISAPLVAAARARAATEQAESVEFLQADAQTHVFQGAGFDAALSRFGVMFFDDPVVAFANIRRALRSAGSLTFVAWRSPADNPCMTAAARAAAPLLPNLHAPDPAAPGQFAFADAERVRTILRDSGWIDIDVSALDVSASVAETDLFAYVTKLGPVGLALRGLDDAQRAPIVSVVHAAYEPYLRGGAARFDMAAWLVRARASSAD